MTDLLFISLADGCVIQKSLPLLIRTERAIDREDDAVSPHNLHSEQERWIGKEAAGRHSWQLLALTLSMKRTRRNDRDEQHCACAFSRFNKRWDMQVTL